MHWREMSKSLFRLAMLDLKRGRYAEAEAGARRSLAILESSQGIQPTEIARDLDVLAAIGTRDVTGHFKQPLTHLRVR
jgi:hypothetical protein